MIEQSPSRALTLAQLLRLPNVFTAIADVLAGYLITHGAFRNAESLPLLIAASCGLYLAGMVLNDVFDRHRDALQRPERPIPSGRISPSGAFLLGMILLTLGLVCAFVASYLTGGYRARFVATALFALVIAYNAGLKRTPLGPIAMGGCRGLNLLLGMSTATVAWHAPHYVVAGGMALYIAGVTLFARTEAQQSNRLPLAAGVAAMAAGLLLAASYPFWAPDDFSPPRFWWPAWGLLLITILWRCVLALQSPSPALVQAAVRNCLMSIIVIDAVLALPATHGGIDPIWIVLLLAPAQFLGRWVYST